MLRKLIPGIYLFGFIAFGSSLHAGDVTFFAGLQKPGTVSREMVVNSISHVFSANDGGGVLGIRYSGKRPITFESGFSYSPHFLTNDQKALQIHTNLLAQFPGHISPYATAGVGLLSTWGGTSSGFLAPLGSIFDFGTRFAINYGGGLKMRNMAGPLGLRFDIRGYTAPGVYSSTLNIFEMSAGAMLSW